MKNRRRIEKYYYLQLKPLLAEEAKKRQGERNDLKDIPQKSAECETREELAKIAAGTD